MHSPTLSRADYEALVLHGHPDTYPQTTAQAATTLKRMGYDATETRLNYYIKQEQLKPGRDGGRNYRWSEADIDAAATLLHDDGHYAMEAQMNRLLDLDYAQRLRALLEAWQKLEEEFPTQMAVNPNSDYFVMHAHPPFGPRRGWVEFTPDEEVLARLRHDKPGAPRFIPIPVREDQYQKAYGYGVKEMLPPPASPTDTTDSQEIK